MKTVQTAFRQRAKAILRRVPPGALIAEIGVYTGRLSAALLHVGCSVIMVDNWLPGAQQAESYRATGDFHTRQGADAVARAEAAARQRAMPYGKRARIIKADSVAAAAMVADHSLDLAFIDADHSLAGCRRDIAAWLPKVKSGGWIGGHDYEAAPAQGHENFGVRQAVDEFVARRGLVLDLGLNLTWFARL